MSGFPKSNCHCFTSNAGDCCPYIAICKALTTFRVTITDRDVKRVYLGSSAVLEQAWGTAGPFWARHYIFWAGNAPLCVIYEVFSPSLERFLGPGKFDIGE